MKHPEGNHGNQNTATHPAHQAVMHRSLYNATQLQRQTLKITLTRKSKPSQPESQTAKPLKLNKTLMPKLYVSSWKCQVPGRCHKEVVEGLRRRSSGFGNVYGAGFIGFRVGMIEIEDLVRVF